MYDRNRDFFRFRNRDFRLGIGRPVKDRPGQRALRAATTCRLPLGTGHPPRIIRSVLWPLPLQPLQAQQAAAAAPLAVGQSQKLIVSGAGHRAQGTTHRHPSTILSTVIPPPPLLVPNSHNTHCHKCCTLLRKMSILILYKGFLHNMKDMLRIAKDSEHT